jgi:hypothetical protein
VNGASIMSKVVFAGKRFEVHERTHAGRSVYYIVADGGEQRLLSKFPPADRKRAENAAFFDASGRMRPQKKRAGRTDVAPTPINKHKTDADITPRGLRDASLRSTRLSGGSVKQLKGSSRQAGARTREILESVRDIGPIAIDGVVFQEYDVASAEEDAGKLAQYGLLMWDEKSGNWPMLHLFVSERERDSALEAIRRKSPHVVLERMILRVPVRLDVHKYKLEHPTRSVLLDVYSSRKPKRS